MYAKLFPSQNIRAHIWTLSIAYTHFDFNSVIRWRKFIQCKWKHFKFVYTFHSRFWLNGEIIKSEQFVCYWIPWLFPLKLCQNFTSTYHFSRSNTLKKLFTYFNRLFSWKSRVSLLYISLFAFLRINNFNIPEKPKNRERGYNV